MSGLTHGDDFVLTGPTKKLMEFEEDDERVSHQSEHRLWVAEEHQNVDQEVALEKARNRVSTLSRHVDELVKDLGIEHGNSVQTQATPDVTEEEELEPLSQVQHHRYRSQDARCLFLSQDRVDNIHRERAVPKDVESQSAEPCQAEKACQVLET